MFENFKRVAMHSLRLGVKDLLVFARDRMMLISFIIMPIFMMVMMGFIFPSQNALKNAPLGIVNLDPGPLGAQIAAVFQQPVPGQVGKMFEIAYPRSQAEAVEQIKKQSINGAIVIPADFSANIAAGQQPSVIIISDQSNPQLSAMLSGVLDSLMSAMSTQLGAAKVASMTGVTSPQAMAIVKPFTVETQGVVPGKPNYFQFMAPGLMAMVIMMAAMTGLAGSISREREVGTLDGILSAPISRLSIVLGKSLAQVVRGLLQAVLTLVLAVVLFGVVIHGNLALLALLLLLTVFSFIGIGIIISAVASQQETAMTIMMTLTFPMLFLSGALFPIQQMPTVMQWISRVLPLTYAVGALRKCIVLGTGITGMMPEVWVMLGFGVVFTAIAIPVFSRIITR
jgi:ABC-2 type transport system permease protein